MKITVQLYNKYANLDEIIPPPPTNKELEYVKIPSLGYLPIIDEDPDNLTKYTNPEEELEEKIEDEEIGQEGKTRRPKKSIDLKAFLLLKNKSKPSRDNLVKLCNLFYKAATK